MGSQTKSRRIASWLVAVATLGLCLGGWFERSTGDAQAVGREASRTAGRAIVGTGEDVGRATSLVVPAAGHPIIAYVDMDQLELKVATCGNAACTTSSIEVAAELTAPWGAAKTAIGLVGGNPVVVYEAVAPGVNPQTPGPSTLHVASCANPTCAGAETNVALDIEMQSGFDAVFDATGAIIVAYDAATGKVVSIACANASCETNTVTPFVTNAPVSTTPSIALTPAGLPIVIYTFGGTDAPNLRICGSRACSGSGSLTTVDGLPIGSGKGANLASTSTGLPVMSHVSQDGAHILLTVCGLSDCRGGNVTTTVGTFNPVAFSGSHDLTVGPGDLPVVAYGIDESGDALALYRCATTTCETGGTRFLFGAEQAEAGDVDLELDTDGFPVIAGWAPHEDGTASFVVRCASVNCGGTPVAAGIGPFELWPNSALAGASDFEIGLEGTNFSVDSVVTFRGVPLATQFVSDIEVTATIPASMIVAVGTGLVGVQGSGFSAEFEVIRSSADIDCSGQATAADALLLLQILAGLATEQGCGSDVNVDFVTGLTDAVYLRRQLAGLEPPLEPELP